MYKIRFRGHGLLMMFINIFFALVTIYWMFLTKAFYTLDGVWELNHLNLADLLLSNGASVLILAGFQILVSIFLLYMFPQPTYLFFELKHLICDDGIANEKDPLALMVFGGQGLLGFALQVWVILAVQNQFAFFKELGFLSVVVLSVTASFGACLGMTDLEWTKGLWLPNVFKHAKLVLNDSKLTSLFVLTTFLLTGTCYLFY